MESYLISKNSDKLMLVFAGWGSDESAFKQLNADFDVSIQKKFYKEKLKIVKNTRHNMFYRIKNFLKYLIIRYKKFYDKKSFI